MNPTSRSGRGLLAAALLTFTLCAQAKVLTLTKAIIDKNSSRIDFGVPTIPVPAPNPDDPPIQWVHNLAAGDTIEIEGHTREQLVLLRINPPNAANNRVTITNKSGGQFIISTGDTAFKKGFTFSGCSNFVLKGTEVSGQPGIVIAQTPADISGITITQYSSGASVIGATNFEVKDLEISNTGFAGLFIKCDGITGSSGVSMDNVLIHRLNIHDTGGEGMYIGASDFAVADRQEIHGIEIRDNTLTNTGWDGIQLGCATQNASIHHNIINGYGVLAAGEDWQDEGIRSNPGTRADIYGNVIIGSPTNSGTGIFADPYNSVKIYNNLIVTPQERGIYILDSEYPKAYTVGYQVTLANNTIIQPGTYGIQFANPAHSAANRLLNNLIVVSPVTRAESILESLVGLRAGNLYRATVEEIGFVAPADGNYDLTAGSPALDIGYNAAGDGVTVDIDGIARPQGSAYDAGAYEYVAPTATAPTITTQPTSRTVTVGASTTFTVAASGTAPLSYQWRKNGASIAGATAASYTISSVQTTHAGGYSVVVSNSAGSATSDTATLTVNSATGLIAVAGYGQAGTAYCPATGTFNEQPTWSAGAPSGVSASPYTATGIAYANRHWYIDFGPNWANVRITGTWTRYMPLTTASYSGLGGMWWDNDTDAVNDGVAAPGLNFATAQGLNTGSGQPWVRDIDATSAPIAPQNRYLIINTGSAPAARANEFAISGYTVN